MKAFDPEIVSGSILRSVWKLAWPVVLLNLVNGLHGFVDHILIGHFVVSENNAGNAAIGISWQVFLVIVVFIASLFHGMNVLIAQYAGQRDRKNMSKALYEAFLCATFFLLFVIAPLGYFLAPQLLNFVYCEPEVRQYALSYLRILFTCCAPLFLMFMFTGAFQASGDPKTPLKLGILTTFLNIVFSTVLITGMGPFPRLGVVGAALGTVLAPVFSDIIAIRLILQRKTILHPPERFSIVPDFSVVRVVVRIGFPTGIQAVLLNLGGVFLLRFIGTLENNSAVQAAYTICYAQLFSLVSWPSFGLRSAAGTVMGQNIGAGDPQRGKQAVRVAARIGFLWALVGAAIFWFFPLPLLKLFNAAESNVYTYGTTLLAYLAFSGLFFAPNLALTGGIQGAGETKLPMYIAFISQILISLGLCEVLWLCDALTTEGIWVAILVSHVSRFLLTYAVFRTEKWVHTKVQFFDSESAPV